MAEKNPTVLFNGAYEEEDISKIISLRTLNNQPNLKIPNYQRPYSWSEESVLTLVNDTFKAYRNRENEYRIGSVILFRCVEGQDVEYQIVDGQQRITTIALLLYGLNKKIAAEKAKEEREKKFEAEEKQVETVENADETKGATTQVSDTGEDAISGEETVFEAVGKQGGTVETDGAANQVSDTEGDTTSGEEKPSVGEILETEKIQEEANQDIESEFKGLFETEYPALSYNVIRKNYEILLNKTNKLEAKTAKEYKEYLLDHCSVVRIVTNAEQEAFQFFDSQNNRGKPLSPHDLLKAYHLREMRDLDVRKKLEVVSKWEDLNTKEVTELFEYYLYPLTQWWRRRDGLYYSVKDIGAFKGISLDNRYNYGIYHKASNLFIEQFNQGHNIISSKDINQFQLTQPLVAGARFFYFTIHYKWLLEQIRTKISQYHKNEKQIPKDGPGERYVYKLYECALLFIADKFGLDAITDDVMHLAYAWSYTLRLVNESVRQESVNKYALGRKEVAGGEVAIALFEEINEMMTPDDLNKILIPKVANDSGNAAYDIIMKKVNGEYDE